VSDEINGLVVQCFGVGLFTHHKHTFFMRVCQLPRQK
jgi:hypothetical protein